MVTIRPIGRSHGANCINAMGDFLNRADEVLAGLVAILSICLLLRLCALPASLPRLTSGLTIYVSSKQ